MLSVYKIKHFFVSPKLLLLEIHAIKFTVYLTILKGNLTAPAVKIKEL